jgi:hypothetical protein
VQHFTIGCVLAIGHITSLHRGIIVNRKHGRLIPLALIIVLITGCIGRMRVGPTQMTAETVELGGADSVRVDVGLGVGEVNIEGGAGDLLEADFTFNVEEWEPNIDYRISGREGRLTVKQPDSNVEGIPDDQIEYTWDLKLSDDVPMDLDVTLGVGDSNLDLRGLSLTNLNVEVGVGEADVDLSGDWPESFDVDIQGGVGSTRVILPREVGVRVRTQTGIGAISVRGLIRDGDVYTNEAYEGADVVLDIEVQGGVGSIELEYGE